MIHKIIAVTHVEEMGLEIYRTLRRHEALNKDGIFVAEGNKVVVRLLKSNCALVSILLTKEWFDTCKEELGRRAELIIVYLASDTMLKAIVGFNYHQGIMAIARIPASKKLDEMCLQGDHNNLFIALDGLSSAENVGVIVRNCAACGVNGIIVSMNSSDPYLRRSVRNSMGAIFTIPILYTENMAETLHDLQVLYCFTTIAAVLAPESVTLDAVDFNQNCCIVLGHEQYGVSEPVKRQCAISMMIPMNQNNNITSFNVACASAIMLYEAFRQRNKKLGSL